MQKVFIQTNNKQLFGARLSKFSIENRASKPVDVEIMNVDEMPIFRDFSGAEFLRRGTTVAYDPEDLQSFTLSRFLPPEKMNYEGRAVVIDPDVFALGDIHELFSFDLKGNALAAKSKYEGWETSVMLLDCSKLTEWNVKNILERLRSKSIDYDTVMRLLGEKRVEPLPEEWNSFDRIDKNTKMLHTTNRLTQPWKSGLPIDFEFYRKPTILGIIPREPILKLLGRNPNIYQHHPDKEVKRFFFSLVKEALNAKAITREDIQREIEKKNVRGDLLSKIDALSS